MGAPHPNTVQPPPPPPPYVKLLMPSRPYLLQQLYLRHRGKKTKKWWKRTMRNMHVWLDFMCMPQPKNEETQGTTNNEITERTQEHTSVESLSPPGRKSSQASQDSRRRSHRCSGGDEHGGELVKRLSDAVDSLPAYVELSWMMLVLAPTLEHQDRMGETVDWCSWRTRGWYSLPLPPSPSLAYRARPLPSWVGGSVGASPR